MRLFALLIALVATAVAGAQTYNQIFDVTDPTVNFQRVAVDAVRNIYLAGTEDGVLIARRLNEDGTEAWTTTLPGTSQARADEITLDADGNVYIASVSGVAPNRIGFFASLNRTTGAVRWTKQITQIDDTFAGGIVTAKVNSSILVYALTTLRLNDVNSDVLALRLSPTTGVDVWRRQINLGGGVTKDLSQRITVNGSGAPILLARRDQAGALQSSVFRLSGTDGSTIFRTDIPGMFTRADSMQVMIGSNNIALSGSSGDNIRPTTMSLINGINGAVIAKENIAGFDRGGRATKFGSYLAPRAGSGTFFMARMNGITGRFAQSTIPAGAERVIGIDAADQIHFSVLVTGTGRIVRAPAGTQGDILINPAAGTVDNKNNIIVIGRADNLNRVMKFSQSMRTNDDNYNQPFGASLSIPAPGVLENDFAPGATLSVVGQPTAGTVVLQQNGAFVYTPNNASVTDDTFAYKADLNGQSEIRIVAIRRNSFVSLSSFKSTVIGSEPVTAFANFAFTPSLPGEIKVTDNSPLISAPASLSINTLSKSTSINVTTAIVTSSLQVTLTANAFGVARSLPITLLTGGLGNFSLGGTSNLVAGQSAVGSVQITAPAPAGGREITLTRVQGLATIPSKVTIPAGASIANFNISTQQSTTGSTLEVHAKLFEGVRVAFRIIEPMAKLESIQVANTIVGGEVVNATIRLDKVSPYNLTLESSLLNNSAGASAPATIAASAGKDFAILPITVPAVTSAKAFRIRIELNDEVLEKTVTVIANPLDRVTAVPTNPTGGQPSVGTVHLNNLAPTGGLTIALSTNRPGLVTVPLTVKIQTASWSTDFQISTKPVAVATGANVIARIANVSKTVVLTLQP